MRKTQLYLALLIATLAVTFSLSLYVALSEPPRVDINRSDTLELQTLPGIGPTLAERIIDGRPYDDVDDLDRVPGIGPQTIETIENKVVW